MRVKTEDFKKITGNYYLSEDEGNGEIVEIIDNYAYLNHRQIGSLNTSEYNQLVNFKI
ncbi:MAG: hypothetical protein ACOCRX_11765 [Candidatus Woesearchaeota archaeon]